MALTDIEAGRLADNVFNVVGANKNLIINGAMQVAQRGTSQAGIISTLYSVCDRFKTVVSGLGTWTVSQDTSAPSGFSNSFKLTCTTADASPAAGDLILVRYSVEAQDLQSLGFGTSDAKSTTMSFWVRSNKTGNASFTIHQRDNSNKQVSFQYSISSADTWEHKTIAIPADTSGVINDDNGEGFEINWSLNSGTNYSSGSHQSTWGTYSDANVNPSNLGVGGATSDYFQITGVQLEVGSVATPFEHRSFGDELLRCQRYFQKSYEYNTAPGTNTDNGKIYNYGSSDGASNIVSQIAPTVAFRTSPTITWYTPAGTAGKWNSARSGSQSDVTMNSYQSGEKRISGYCALGAAWTTGYAQGHYIAAAEF